MKKTASLIMAICMALLLTVPAFADGRGPAFTSYDVVCTKDTPYYRENWERDGAMEKKGTFPAGSTLTVEYEYETDGETYGWVSLGHGDDQEWMYVRISDVELKNDTYLPENAQKLPQSHSVRVIAKGGVTLYAGPNTKYDKVLTIPRGAKLTYSFGNDSDDYYRTWAYVTYLNKSGWIYVYASDTKNGLAELPQSDQNAEIWVLSDDVKMYDGISFGNMEDELSDDWGPDAIKERHEEPDRVVGTLKQGNKYTYRYSHGQDYGTWYYVTAGLRSGWVFMSDANSRVAAATTQQRQSRFLTFKPIKLKLREAPNAKAGGTTVSIAGNTPLGSEYYAENDYDTFYYTTIQGQSGWYSREDADKCSAYKLDPEDVYHGYYNRNESKTAAPIYKDILSRGKAVGKIPAGSLFTPLYYGSYEQMVDAEHSEYTWFYYVRYNDVKGWVDEQDLWTPDEEDAVETEEEWEDETDWDEEEWEEDTGWDEEEEEWEDETDWEDAYDDVYDAPKSGLSPMQIVLVCVGGAVILALTAAVTLLLIRRKRNAAAQAPAEPTQPGIDPPDQTE